MNGNKGPRTIEQGVQTPMYLIDLPFEIDEQKQGKFFKD